MGSTLPRDPRGLCDRIGASVPEPLLIESLTHRSYAYERGGLQPNERLEFLGDAVLGLVVTDTLFTRNPDLAEGQLAKMRSAVVSSKALAKVAREIDLGSYLLLGNGEVATGGRDKASILADAVEAVIGAVHIGCGPQKAADVIHLLVDPLIEQSQDLGAGLDWKTSLQELSSRLSLGVPEYVVVGTGPDHDRTFTAQVKLADGLHGHGSGATKKEAEQLAASAAYRELSVLEESEAEPAPGKSEGSTKLQNSR